MLDYLYVVYMCFIKYTLGSGLGASFFAVSSFYKQQNLL